MLKNWVILDRDGTLIEEEQYLSSPEKVKLLPGVVEGLCLLANAGCRFIIVTNQSGIGRGYFSEEDMNAVNQNLIKKLDTRGIQIEGTFFCPHTPEDHCGCRKPGKELIMQAAKEKEFAVEQICCVIGDKESDILLGNALGCNAIFVLTGHGQEEKRKIDVSVCQAVNFLEAARIVLDQKWIGV